jgi:tetratricopeptide (TPR) repeat protein
VTDRLRQLWDFSDLDSSEARLRDQLAREEAAEGRAEVLAELARVEGLRGDFAAGERLVDEAAGLAGTSSVARARIDLERGRLRRSAGDPKAALPLFESAFRLALEAGHGFIATDAAHMAALASPDEGFVDWTQRGIELAESNADARYWLGPLLNNLGWHRYEAGLYDDALDAFERALEAREADPGNRSAIELARYAVGKALRALGRSEEAIPLLERAVAWAEGEGAPDGWFHEELAEEYAAVGRAGDAGEHAARALGLLAEQDAALESDEPRRSRLEALARAQ